MPVQQVTCTQMVYSLIQGYKGLFYGLRICQDKKKNTSILKKLEEIKLNQKNCEKK